MDRIQLLFEHSPWWVLVCLLIGAGYAFLLYQKKGPWSARTNKLLGLVRGLLVAFIAFLLINPLLKQILNEIEKPVYVLAVDNSQSIVEEEPEATKTALVSALLSVQAQIAEEGAESSIYSFNDQNLSVDSIRFDAPSTNLSSLLRQIENDFEGKNLAGVILFSDGIFNQGISPDFRNYAYPISTVGLGDTIPRRDLKIRNLLYNEIAYQGNRFPVVAEVQNEGFENATTVLSVMKNGQVIASENVSFEGPGVKEVTFTLDADEAGFQRYSLSLNALPEEKISANNRMNAYLEVIEGKEQILIASAAPHPDIKAITASLSRNQNYEITQFIAGINDFPEGKYDLIIIHEAFDRSRKLGGYQEQLFADGQSLLLIMGNRSNFNQFNESVGMLSFEQKRGQKDQVRPAINDNFTAFNLNPDINEVIETYPPIEVPYGDFTINANTDILLYQQVGSIVTDKPLIAVTKKQESKIAVVMGEGIWQWRLQEYAQEDDAKVFDELISKLVQYLSTKEDRRRFRFSPEKNEYFDSEPIVFKSEVYNDIYEPVYGYDITIQLKSEAGEIREYSYTTSPTNSNFAIGQLPAGIYQYTASTNLDNRKVSVNGEFSVKELQLESISLTAKHNLLRNLSQNSGGNFYSLSDINQIGDALAQQDAKGIIYSSESYQSVINLKWIFFLLIALVSIEWFTRKFNGSY